MRCPRGRWRWPKCTHGGVDRQGRGRSQGRASPEMRPGSHHDDWAATPRAAPQSLRKTPVRSNVVALSCPNHLNEHVMTRCAAKGAGQAPARRLCRKLVTSGTADAAGAAAELLSWTTAKAM